MAEKNIPASQPTAPAAAGQNDALAAMLTARDTLTAAKAKLVQAVKDQAFYSRKVEREGNAVLAAQKAFDEAEAAFKTPSAK